MNTYFAFLLSGALIVCFATGFPGNLPVLSFHEGFSHLFGEDNLMIHRDGKSVHISLDERTGSGFVSQDLYLHGYFSASIKLRGDYTAGVVVAFYMSNADTHEKNHDEIDFEFLGNIRGKEWRIQTNFYGNGSTNSGREERYGLWFDPTEDFHHYSLLWTDNLIVFFVDDVPIREIKRRDEMGGDFPSKPMSVYATIWDGSDWATNGGKYRVNYKYAPFVSEFSDLVLHGCSVDPIEPSKRDCLPGFGLISEIAREQRRRMGSFRSRHMQYSYCYDRARYKIPLPECVLRAEESDSGTFGGSRRRRRRSPAGKASSV